MLKTAAGSPCKGTWERWMVMRSESGSLVTLKRKADASEGEKMDFVILET